MQVKKVYARHRIRALGLAQDTALQGAARPCSPPLQRRIGQLQGIPHVPARQRLDRQDMDARYRARRHSLPALDREGRPMLGPPVSGKNLLTKS